MFSVLLDGALGREREGDYMFESWLCHLLSVTLNKFSPAGACFLVGKQDDHTRTYIIASL